MKPKGVIFDFDGVMVDSLHLHLKGWSFAYQEIFHKELEAHVLSSLVGRSTQGIAKFLAQKENGVDKAAQLVAKKFEYIEGENVFASIFPNIPEFMQLLARWEVPFGIASHSPRRFIEKHLKIFGLNVSVIIGLEDCRAFKPSPEPFLLCARTLGISFTDHAAILVFEDSIPGIVAANKAGMISVGIATQHSLPELYDGGANVACLTIGETMEPEWMANVLKP